MSEENNEGKIIPTTGEAYAFTDTKQSKEFISEKDFEFKSQQNKLDEIQEIAHFNVTGSLNFKRKIKGKSKNIFIIIKKINIELTQKNFTKQIQLNYSMKGGMIQMI